MTAAGAHTRTRILDEALGLFVEKGIAETTTRDIARAAGLGDASMYRHFPSKDALVRELFLVGYADYARSLRALAGQGGPIDARLARMVRGLCRLFDEDPDRFRFLLLHQHEHLAHVAAGAENPVDILRDVLAEAIAADEIAVRDPDLATAWVMGVVLQTAVARCYGRITTPFADLAEDLTAACLRVLGR